MSVAAGLARAPVRHADRRQIALAVVTYLVLLGIEIRVFGLSLTEDRYLFVLLGPALVLRVGRRYVLDFLPFGLLLLGYEELRGVAHVVHPHPYVTPHLDAERWLFAGHVPTTELQRWLWQGHLRWWDQATVAMTKIHFWVPPTLAFLLWLKRRALFFRFAAAFLLLSYLGAITFAIYPAAPPWAAARDGFIDPVVRITTFANHASALPTASGPLYRLLLPNPYAAIPSLHGGYSFLVFLTIVMLAWRTRWRWWAVAGAALYPLAQGFAVVYTGNHYVVDLLVGYAYAAAAVFVVERFWRRRGLPS
jgi:membrane-associated phospholipid phosphatase